MPTRERIRKVAGVLAMVAAAGTIGLGCAEGGGAFQRSRRIVGSDPAPGGNPYTTMRPTYDSPRGRIFARPVYLSGYAGYNYSKASSGLTETAYDGRYYRKFPRIFSGQGQ